MGIYIIYITIPLEKLEISTRSHEVSKARLKAERRSKLLRGSFFFSGTPLHQVKITKFLTESFWEHVKKAGWWFQTFFYFHPYLGKWSNLTNIFQMGWNHQLERLCQTWELRWQKNGNSLFFDRRYTFIFMKNRWGLSIVILGIFRGCNWVDSFNVDICYSWWLVYVCVG